MAEAIMFLIVAQNIRTMIDEDSNSLLSSVRTEAQALNNELTKLEEHVAKAETNSPNTNEQVRARFAEARRIVYDAEDVVDKFVSKTESSAFSSVRLLPRSRKDSKKLRRLRDQITGMMATIDNGSPRDNESPRAGNELAVRQAQRHVDDEFVVGIEADVDKLVGRLVDKPEFNVLTIVGMGGSGKSTLARKLYNHKEVTKHFKYRAWVSLPKEWGPSHEKHLLLELLVKMGGSGRKIPIDHLQQNPITMVQNLLENKKCLVVLDDVWNWEYLQEMVNKLLLPSSGVSNSKIVITSRQFLPSPDNKWIFHETKLLSNEDSFTLFNKVSSSGNKRELAKEYQGLAKEMLIKCKGLPLAIVALGKLLKKKDTIEEWERVFSQFEGKEGSYLYGPVTDILALSYYELPDYLKPFFLYLGLLVEEHINASALKRMWVAEGFVKNQQKEGETPEKAATRLLQELVNHTMVQPVTYTYTRKVKTVQVHNLMRDVCVMIAQELDFLTLVSNHPHSRRAAIDLSKGSALLYNNSSLRSLMVFKKSSTGQGFDRQYSNILDRQGILDCATVFEKLKLLRVLDIVGIKAYDGIMPKEIGNLIHLRYLRIKSTNIRELPKSLGKLRKLLTFDYRDVRGDNEIRLPNVFCNLERLRHLFLPNEMMSNTNVDLKLDTLKDLQTLWGIRGGDWMLKDMATMSCNLTKLRIQGISSQEQLEAVFNYPAIKNLYALVLDWYGFSSIECINKLCSNELQIQKLRLLGRAPDEKTPLRFSSNLGKLELYYTYLEKEETMDALGMLPHLKFLGLAKDSFVGCKWTCKENTFTSLEELNLSNLPKLENWLIEKETMPSLKNLSIISCEKLQRLPDNLKSLKELETLNIRRMPTSFNSRLKQKQGSNDTSQGGEDFEIVQHIPKFTVLDSCASFSI